MIGPHRDARVPDEGPLACSKYGDPSHRFHVLVGIGAIACPGIHTLTDIAEWLEGGFSAPQLWANYLVFMILPFVMIGLYSAQRPNISAMGLVGAILYGASFIYFTHTSLYALAEDIPDYPSLWERLGIAYTIHGLLLILGGLAFGAATYRAGVFPRWVAIVFIAGVMFTLVLAIIAAPEMFQTLGSALRNLGLIGMGAHLIWRSGERSQR